MQELCEQDKLVRLRLITHNARLVDARKEKGLTQEQLGDKIGLAQHHLSAIETLRRVPTEDEVCRMAVALEKMPDYLFPPRLLRAIQVGVFSKRQVELEAPHVDQLIRLNEPALLTDGGIDAVQERLDAEPLPGRVEQVFKTLSDREVRVLRLRFGFDGPVKTLEEVGRVFNIKRERVRQIEGKALRKLRHPVRSRFLIGKTDELKASKPPPDRILTENPKRYARKVPPDSQVGICDICGKWVGRYKGQHILREHPEYPICTKTKNYGSIYSYKVTWYYCTKCHDFYGSPAQVVNHINIEHPELLLSSNARTI